MVAADFALPTDDSTLIAPLKRQLFTEPSIARFIGNTTINNTVSNTISNAITIACISNLKITMHTSYWFVNQPTPPTPPTPLRPRHQPSPVNMLVIESYNEHIISTICIATFTMHYAPAQRIVSLAVAVASVAGAHLKWYLATVKSGPRAVAAALQQQAVAAVVDMLQSASFPAAVVDSELNITIWNAAISSATR